MGFRDEGAANASSVSLMGLMTHRERRSDDHRIKVQIAAAGDPYLFFPELEILRSTAMSWIRRGVGEIVAIDDDSHWDAPWNQDIQDYPVQ